jgi:hypothetical protein
LKTQYSARNSTLELEIKEFGKSLKTASESSFRNWPQLIYLMYVSM